MRLTVAAILALGVHAAFLWFEVPWSRPDLIVPLSRAVTIDLVTFDKPDEKPIPPKPKAPPTKPERMRPKPVPKPVIKSAAQPRPEPHPVASEPVIEEVDTPEFLIPDEDLSEDASQAQPQMDMAVTDATDDRAAVQASVPLYDLNPPPRYPRAARKRNYQGTVMLDVLVTANGSVAQVRIAQSSGYKILDRSAAKSVKGWRFSPALRAGLPIEMWVQVPVRFELH